MDFAAINAAVKGASDNVSGGMQAAAGDVALGAQKVTEDTRNIALIAADHTIQGTLKAAEQTQIVWDELVQNTIKFFEEITTQVGEPLAYLEDQFRRNLERLKAIKESEVPHDVAEWWRKAASDVEQNMELLWGGIKKFSEKVLSWVSDNGVNITFILGGAALIAIPFVIPEPTLGALGFAAGGVVAGSLASQCQSLFLSGVIKKGSLFSLAQSLGAGGVSGGLGHAGVGFIFVGATCIVIGARNIVMQWRKKEEGDEYEWSEGVKEE